MIKAKYILILTIVLLSGTLTTGCKNSKITVDVPAASQDQSGSNNGGGGGGGGGGPTWWDSLTGYSNNVSFKITPNIGAGANPGDQDVLTSYSFVHEYTSNKMISVDNGYWNAPYVRFISVNSDNTSTVEAVTPIPFDSNYGTIQDNESNIVGFKSANKFASSRFFKPIGGASENDLSVVSFNPTTHAVSVDSFYTLDRETVIALDSNE